MSLPKPDLDDLTYAELVEQARAQIPIEYLDWTDHNPSDTGMILIEMLAWLTEMVLYRVNQVPDRSIETMLGLLRADLNLKAEDLQDNATRSLALQRAVQDTLLQLRQRYRAVTCDDFEQLALEWYQKHGEAGKQIRVRCFPDKDFTNSARRNNPDPDPGHVSLVVVPPQVGELDLTKLPPQENELIFDGDNDYVSIPSLKGLSGSNPTHTLEAWVYVQELRGARRCILLMGPQTSGAHHWLLDGDGMLYLGIYNGGQRRPNMTAGVWTHIAVVSDQTSGNASLKAYINGDGSINNRPLAISQGVAFTIRPTPTLMLGKKFGQEIDFKGKIAEVRLWNTARTEAEIRANMHSRLTGKETGLVGYWPLNEGTGSIANDQTQNQNQGTITGATWQTMAVSSPLPPLYQDLWKYLDDRRLLTIRHHVVMPTLVGLTIQAKLFLEDGANQANVQQTAETRLKAFFHPFNSGNYWKGKGYPLGRSIPKSEIYALLDEIAGVDYVREVVLSAPGKEPVSDKEADPTNGTSSPSPGAVSNPSPDKKLSMMSLKPYELVAVQAIQLEYFDRAGRPWL